MRMFLFYQTGLITFDKKTQSHKKMFSIVTNGFYCPSELNIRPKLQQLGLQRNGIEKKKNIFIGEINRREEQVFLQYKQSDCNNLKALTLMHRTGKNMECINNRAKLIWREEK